MTRTLVLICVAAAALATAGNAFSSYAPKLVVRQSGPATTVSFTVPARDDPSAALTVFAPAGAAANLSAGTGSTLGTVEAKAAAGALGGTTITLRGSVRVRAAEGAILDAATRCTGTPVHAAYWLLVLTSFGQTIEVPVFVDPVPEAAAAAPFVSFALSLCLPAPDIPESLGGAPFGANLYEATFTVNGVFVAPRGGDNLWRLLATPYARDQGTADVPSTVEAQSFVETASIALGEPRRELLPKSATFQVAGTVQVEGLSDTSAAVALARGATATRLAAFLRAAARPDGRFSTRFAIRRARRAQVVFVQAAASAPARDLAETACKGAFGVPCIGATASGFVAKSTTRRVSVPAAPRPR